MRNFQHIVKDEEGATALEYGLLAALIASVIVGSVMGLGGVISNAFAYIGGVMQAAGS